MHPTGMHSFSICQSNSSYLFNKYRGLADGSQRQLPACCLPPANKIWGNLMLQVFVCPRGGGVCMMSLPIWLPGPMFLLEGLSSWSHVRSSGGLCLGGLCLGGLCPGGLCPRGGLCRETPTRNQKSRRYASYWNAFLFTLMLERLRGFF